MVRKCKDCKFWVAICTPPYCVMKDLYSETEAEQECDEFDWMGNPYFSKKA